MALTPTPVTEARQAAQYDGTNSAEFNAAIPAMEIVSENTSGLTFTSGGESFAVAPGGYITWTQAGVDRVFQNEQDYTGALAPLHGDHVHDLVLTTGPAKAPEA